MEKAKLDTEEARQGERKTGMPLVLAGSTILAALVVGVVLVAFTFGGGQ